MSAENGKLSTMQSVTSSGTGHAIKKEPTAAASYLTNGDSLRLSSFASPRDLTLGGRGGGAVNKKVFIPNLNVVRNKNANVKTSKDTSTRGRNRSDRGKTERGGRGRGGRGGNTSALIQTAGVFSEGAGAVNLRRTATSSSSSYSRSAEDTPSAMRKPTLIKRETKIDVKADAAQIRELMGDSDDDDFGDEKTDLETFPIKLNEAKWKYIKSENIKPKVEPMSEIKPEVVEDCPEEDKTEAIVKKIQSMRMNRTVGPSNVHQYPSSVEEFFQSDQPQIFIMQLPDTLPCEDDPSEGIADNRSNTLPAAIASTSKPNGENMPTNTQASAQQPKSNSFKQMEEGQVGKLLRYKSGKYKLVLGESHFDLDMGMETGFLQDLMSISTNREERSGNMINLGPIQAKLTATPDWEYLLKQQ